MQPRDTSPSSSSDTDGSPAIAGSTAVVRAALRAWLLGSAGTTQLRHALRLFGDDARRRGLRPEEMLVEFKTACRSVPETLADRSVENLNELLARAVTICIEEFYAVADRAPPATGGVTAPSPERTQLG